MPDAGHSARVADWVRGVPHAPDQAVAVLETTLQTLWRQCERTLGEVTLTAVLERVLHDAAFRYPVYDVLELDAKAGIDFTRLKSRVRAEHTQEVREGMRFILMQFLQVVGNLTGDILTPGLYRALETGMIEVAEKSPLALLPSHDQQKEAPAMIVNPVEPTTQPSRTNGQRGIGTKPEIQMLETGIPNLDLILNRGLPKGSVTIVAGPPGSGKTVLAQQICFHNASADCPVLYFNTLSEPMAKALLYLRQFSFFDAEKIDKHMHLVDLGDQMRSEGPEKTATSILEHVKRVKPGIIVVDSFKSFDDFNKSGGEMRKFGYQMAVHLMAWEVTALLLGEYAPDDYQTRPFFSIADGLMSVTQKEVSGEYQRYIQVHKMRGVNHNRDPQVFSIGDDGLQCFTPLLNIKRTPEAHQKREGVPRLRTGIAGLDELLDGGIPTGFSVLLAGGPGTGKTVMCLDFLYRGALAGEKGIVFSVEETVERLLSAAQGLGWDMASQVERGMIEIVFIPQTDIMLEADLLMIQQKIQKLGARRVVIDSVSVLLHKVSDKRLAQEKVFQLATIVQNAGAVGFFATDIPFGSDSLSRFGIEETIVDGVIMLSAKEEGRERVRYLEVYKMRNTAHGNGSHDLLIGTDGVSVVPRPNSVAKSGVGRRRADAATNGTTKTRVARKPAKT